MSAIFPRASADWVTAWRCWSAPRLISTVATWTCSLPAASWAALAAFREAMPAMASRCSRSCSVVWSRLRRMRFSSSRPCARARAVRSPCRTRSMACSRSWTPREICLATSSTHPTAATSPPRAMPRINARVRALAAALPCTSASDSSCTRFCSPSRLSRASRRISTLPSIMAGTASSLSPRALASRPGKPSR
ncbi:MAG: hypothetical protein ABSH53_05285 [Holophaga sp.]